jgi:hypothetical protein
MSARSIHFSSPDHYCLHFAKRHRRHSVCNDAYESNNNVNFYLCVQELERQPRRTHEVWPRWRPISASLASRPGHGRQGEAGVEELPAVVRARRLFDRARRSAAAPTPRFRRRWRSRPRRRFSATTETDSLMYVSPYAQQMRYVCEGIAGLLIK